MIGTGRIKGVVELDQQPAQFRELATEMIGKRKHVFGRNVRSEHETKAKFTFVQVDQSVPDRPPPRDTFRSGANGSDRDRSD